MATSTHRRIHVETYGFDFSTSIAPLCGLPSLLNQTTPTPQL
jgi:hypothetical protein